MASKFVELAEKILEETEKPMRAAEIWDYACMKGYNKDVNTKGKTPIASLGARIYVDIQNNPDNTKLIQLDRGLFGLKEYLEKAAYQKLITTTEKNDSKNISSKDAKEREKILEKEMHAPLANYLALSNIYSKTINANRVSGTITGGIMKWGTPDIVGVYFRNDLRNSVKIFCEKTNIPTIELYAYELKRELTSSSLTEYFFQAVSNSTWANEAWLVYKDCYEIENNDTAFKEEISRLNQAFGVGVLKLDIENIHDSKIILPAIRRNNLDLTTLNKLCANTDFDEFLKSVTEIIDASYKNREAIINDCIAKGHFDKIDIDDL